MKMKHTMLGLFVVAKQVTSETELEKQRFLAVGQHKYYLCYFYYQYYLYFKYYYYYCCYSF